MIRLRAVVAAALLALAGCGSSVPSTEPPTSDPTPFDLSGTAWRAVSVSGQAVPGENAPHFTFTSGDDPGGYGSTGCNDFLFSATIEGDRMTITDVTPPPTACTGDRAQLEELFLTAFQATQAWSVAGDQLTLVGVPGEIVLARELPPPGDPGRQLADALMSGEWRVLRATGVVGLDGIPPVTFTDTRFITRFIAGGRCGFSGEHRFGSGGALDIVDVGWDVAGGCDGGPNDPRVALRDLLVEVTMGRPGADGTIVLSGPEGEVVLGR